MFVRIVVFSKVYAFVHVTPLVFMSTVWIIVHQHSGAARCAFCRVCARSQFCQCGAFVHFTPLVLVCIVVVHLLVPPLVHFDANSHCLHVESQMCSSTSTTLLLLLLLSLLLLMLLVLLLSL